MSEEIVAPPGADVEVLPVAAPRLCKKCSKPIEGKAPNSKYCKNCVPQAGTAEKRESNRLSKEKSRAREKVREEKSRQAPQSEEEISEKDAVEILTARGLHHPRVIETCIELGRVAARNLRIPFNSHLLLHGIQKTLAVREKREFVAPDSMTADVWMPGEPIREMERYALWDFSTSWRTQPDGSQISYLTFKELRRISQTDLFRFGKDIIGLDMHEEPHGRWCRELFVQKNPDLLPENYSWEDVKVALAAQSDIRQRMLIASRSSYKSSVNLVDLLQWTLVFFGDIRIFIVSATTPLSAGFLRKYRGYFTLKNPNEPTLFNQLWPEFMVSADDSSSKKNFVSPMRRLDLIQPTLASAGLDSEGLAGERTDLFVLEDIAEINNSSKPEQRQRTLEKVTMLRELVEPFGSVQIVGTPISAGAGTEEDPGDIYSTMLTREANHLKDGGEPQLRYLICPAWTVKDGVNKEAYDVNLLPEEVILLFPSRLSFQYLLGKLRDNQKVYRQQSLCTWVPDEDTLDLLNFDRALLLRNTIQSAAAPTNGEVVIVADIAHSISPKADRSAIAVVRICTDVASGEKSMIVLDVIAERMRASDFAVKLVLACRKWNPRSVVIERSPTWDLLQAEITRATQKYPAHVPLYWKTPSNVKNAKFLRLKGLEGLIAAGRIKFISGPYIDTLFAEMEKLDGTTGGGSTRKDDQCDALGICQMMFCPAIHYTMDKTEESDEFQREELKEIRKREQYSRIFGNQYTPPPPKLEPEEPKQTDMRYRVFGSKGPWRL